MIKTILPPAAASCSTSHLTSFALMSMEDTSVRPVESRSSSLSFVGHLSRTTFVWSCVRRPGPSLPPALFRSPAAPLWKHLALYARFTIHDIRPDFPRVKMFLEIPRSDQRVKSTNPTSSPPGLPSTHLMIQKQNTFLSRRRIHMQRPRARWSPDESRRLISKYLETWGRGLSHK